MTFATVLQLTAWPLHFISDGLAERFADMGTALRKEDTCVLEDTSSGKVLPKATKSTLLGIQEGQSL